MAGISKMLGGDFRGGFGDMAFGHDAYYDKYLKKQFGFGPPPEEIIVPGGGEQVGYGDYTGSLGASAGQNPYAMIRGR